MSIRPTYTLLEYKHSLGQTFQYFYGKNGLGVGLSENILLRIGKKPVVVNELKVTGDITTLFWRWFENSVITSTDPAKEIFEIHRNSVIPNTSSGTTAFYNPVISDDGIPLIPAGVGINGLTTQNARSSIDRTLTRQSYTLRPDTDYLLRITNNGADIRNFEVEMNLFMLND